MLVSSGNVDPRLCPADLFPLQIPLSVAPHSNHACMTRISPPETFSAVPPGIPALYVAQPCSYASEQERTESFFSPLPLSPVPRTLGMCGMRGACCSCPTVLGAVSLPSCVHAPHEVPPGTAEAEAASGMADEPLSPNKAARLAEPELFAGSPVPPGTDSLSCTQRTQRHVTHVRHR